MPENVNAAIISGRVQANVCEPACWSAKTNTPELHRSVNPPTKSMLVKARQEKTFAAFSCGQKFVITSMAISPKGMLLCSSDQCPLAR